MAALYCPILVACFVLSGLNTEAKELKVSSVVLAPYLYKHKDGNYSGYLIDLYDKLGYNYTIVENDYFGAKFPNGSWTGMVEDIVNGDADVAGPLTVTSTRMEAVDFSYPILSVGPVIIMRKPPLDKPSLRRDLLKLLRPFSFSVWLISVLALLVTGTVLYLISHFNPYEWRRMAKDREATLREAESFTCLNSFWFILSTLFLQGYVRSPRSIGGRIVVAAWWVYVILFIFSYLASLTNYLRVGREPYSVEGYSKIRSMANLADNEDIGVGVIPMGSTEAYFRTSSDNAEKRIYDKIIATRKEISEDISTSSNLIKYLRERPFADFAVILETDLARFNAYQRPCDLYIVNEGSVTRQISLAFKKGSQQFQEEFNLKLVKLAGSGELRYLENRWFRSECASAVYTPDPSSDVVFNAFYALDLGTFSGAILILLVGIAIGGLVTMVEICIYKCAETHYDEDASTASVKRGSLDGVDTNHRLIPNSENKRGGATQV